MSSVFFADEIRLKSYTATTKSGVSSIKIELEARDHYALASVLRQLDEIDAEQKAASRPVKVSAPKAKKPRLALPAPALQLPYFGEGE